MSEQRFVVAYDGPALEDHTMNARDLAFSVLAMSDAFHQAQHVVTPGAPPATLSIRAFEGGSFEVAMVLVESHAALEGAIDFLLDRPMQSAISLGTLVSLVWGSLRTLKAMRGRQPRTARTAGTGETELTFEDGQKLTVPTQQLPLIRDIEYRRKVSEFLSPLDGERITSIRVTDTAVKLTVTAGDVPAMLPPDVPREEDLGTEHRHTTLQLLGVEFDGRKWRFTEGVAAISASIEDEKFRDQIERQAVTFGKNDLLKVRLRTRQYRDSTGRLRAEHAIEEVLEHIDGGRQLPLDFES